MFVDFLFLYTTYYSVFPFSKFRCLVLQYYIAKKKKLISRSHKISQTNNILLDDSI